MPRPAARRRATLPQSAEVCEPRTLLTTFVVTDGGDATDAGDGELTYREALLAAEAEAGADIITFAEGVDVVTLAADLPDLTGDLSVVADAAGITIDHAGHGGLGLAGGDFAFSDVTFANAGLDDRPVLDVSGGATLTVAGGAFEDNRGATTFRGSRAAVRLTGADAAFTGTHFEGNVNASRGAVAAFGDSELRLIDVTAVRNTGGVVRGAFTEDGGDDGEQNFDAAAPAVTITGGYFALNDSGERTVGSVVDLSGGTLAVADATFSTNTGRAVRLFVADATVVDSLFFRNDGGALGAAVEFAELVDQEREGESNVTITDSTFTRNTASSGGAVLIDGATATLTGVRMFNNVASPDDPTASFGGRGGAVFLGFGSDVTVEGGRYARNRANRFGGAFYTDAYTDSLSLSNVSINRNVAGREDSERVTGGGAVYTDTDAEDASAFRVSSVELTLDNVFAARNAAVGPGAFGGALDLADTRLTVTDSNLAGNSATRSGGTAYMAGGDATFTDSFLRGGRAELGAGLAVYESVFFSFSDGVDVTFTGGGLIGNEATGRGGGFILGSGFRGPVAATFEGARLRGNRAANGGAGHLENRRGFQRDGSSVARITGDSVLRNNRAENVGGAFSVESELILDGVTAVGNRARRGAVAFAFEDDPIGDGVVRVLDAVFRGNSDDELDGAGRIRDRR